VQLSNSSQKAAGCLSTWTVRPLSFFYTMLRTDDEALGRVCSCKTSGECHCWTHRSRPGNMPSSSSQSLPIESSSRAMQPHYRPVLPRPPNRRRTSDASLSSTGTGPIHDPSEGLHHGNGHHGRRASFYSPYGRAYEYASMVDQGNGNYPPPPPSTVGSESSVDEAYSVPYHHSNRSRDFDFDFTYAPPSGPIDVPMHPYRADSQLSLPSSGGGRAQPHHEAPFAPPQTPTDLPLPSWPVSLPPHSHANTHSFSALGIGARGGMDVDMAHAALPPSLGRADPPFRADPPYARSDSETGLEQMLDLPLCGCGDACTCVGCVEHAGAPLMANAYDTCANPSSCAMCLQCSILALPDADFGGLAPGFPPGVGDQALEMGGMMDIDEWLRSVAPHGDPTSPGHPYAAPPAHAADYANAAYAFGEDAAVPPPPPAERPDAEFYDVAFDPNLLATWEPPAGLDPGVLPELFLPEPGGPSGYPPAFGYDAPRFATSGERGDDPGRPELLVVPPTPAMRAGSGLGLSRADTLDAEAENARYLAAHLAAIAGTPSPGSSGSSPHSDAASNGSGSRRDSQVVGSSLSSSDSSSLGSAFTSGSSAPRMQPPGPAQQVRTQNKFKLFGAMPGLFGNKNKPS
jgi:hypothetical protein